MAFLVFNSVMMDVVAVATECGKFVEVVEFVSMVEVGGVVYEEPRAGAASGALIPIPALDVVCDAFPVGRLEEVFVEHGIDGVIGFLRGEVFVVFDVVFDECFSGGCCDGSWCEEEVKVVDAPFEVLVGSLLGLDGAYDAFVGFGHAAAVVIHSEVGGLAVEDVIGHGLEDCALSCGRQFLDVLVVVFGECEFIHKAKIRKTPHVNNNKKREGVASGSKSGLCLCGNNGFYSLIFS